MPRERKGDLLVCDPSYSFPPQRETVEFCVSVATQAVARNTRTLIVVSTYTIGKEKIFVGNLVYQNNIPTKRLRSKRRFFLYPFR